MALEGSLFLLEASSFGSASKVRRRFFEVSSKVRRRFVAGSPRLEGIYRHPVDARYGGGDAEVQFLEGAPAQSAPARRVNQHELRRGEHEDRAQAKRPRFSGVEYFRVLGSGFKGLGFRV